MKLTIEVELKNGMDTDIEQLMGQIKGGLLCLESPICNPPTRCAQAFVLDGDKVIGKMAVS